MTSWSENAFAQACKYVRTHAQMDGQVENIMPMADHKYKWTVSTTQENIQSFHIYDQTEA